MKHRKTVRTIGTVVGLVGALVMLGWILDIGILKSILPHWVSMKVLTAISFILSGITLYVMASYLDGKKTIGQVILPASSATIIIIMVTLMVSSLLGMRLGIEDFFVREEASAVKSVAPGMPSIGTMTAFILCALAGGFTLFNVQDLQKKLLVMGWLVVALGTSAMLGYMANAPLLYYYIKGASTAMAFHTALLFTALGTGLILLSKTIRQDINAMKYPLGTKIGAGIALCITIMIVISALSLISITKFIDSFKWVQSTQEFANKTNATVNLLRLAQLNQRNYVISGSDSYLKDAEASFEQIDTNLNDLIIMATDVQQKRLDEFQKAITD
ncbi:multi-sensor hybrid histidine kinase, partial [Candidatus Magnetobacterium bavaricum]